MKWWSPDLRESPLWQQVCTGKVLGHAEVGLEGPRKLIGVWEITAV
jgi:hypothetical protein